MNKSRTQDSIRLPPFRVGVPTRTGWRAAVTETAETQMIDNRVKALTAAGLCGHDLVGTFIQRRVLPLQWRDRKICHMSGLMDPTRTSTFAISNDELYRQCRAIGSVPRMATWKWGVRAYTRKNPVPKVYL